MILRKDTPKEEGVKEIPTSSRAISKVTGVSQSTASRIKRKIEERSNPVVVEPKDIKDKVKVVKVFDYSDSADFSSEDFAEKVAEWYGFIGIESGKKVKLTVIVEFTE
jgi:hypothetical protein